MNKQNSIDEMLKEMGETVLRYEVEKIMKVGYEIGKKEAKTQVIKDVREYIDKNRQNFTDCLGLKQWLDEYSKEIIE